MEANANQLLNSVKFLSTAEKTENYSEAFKNSGKEAPVRTSLEHESKETNETDNERKTEKINLKKNSKM